MSTWRGWVRSGFVALVVLLGAGPVVAHAACAGADTPTTAANARQASAAILCLVNEQRASQGLQPLKASRLLRRAAARHSRDMVARRFFAHDSPSGSTIVSRVRKTGYLRGARTFMARENLAWDRGGTPRTTVRTWMRSSIHRTNILSPTLRDAGVAVVRGTPFGGRGRTITMVFGARR